MTEQVNFINTHEQKVDNFYATGLTEFHDHNGGYLNFGLWDKDNTYIQAAEHLIHTLGSHIGLNKKSHVLDVACGMAPQCVYLNKHFGAKIDAIDITWKHVEIANERIQKEKLQQEIQVHHASATNLPFKNNTFTHVTGVEGQPHFNTREDFLGEAYRVLKKGGILGLTDYTIERKPRTLWEGLLLWAAVKLWQCRKENEYSIEVYKEKLKKKGFKNITIEDIGARVIPGYVMFQRKKETRRKLKNVRGTLVTYGGLLIDHFMYQIYKKGIMTYVLVRAEK